MPGRKGINYIPLGKQRIIEVGPGLSLSSTYGGGYRGNATETFLLEASASGTTTNVLSKPSVNQIQSTVNGVASAVVPIIQTNVVTVATTGISTTVNGVTSNVAPIFSNVAPIADNEADTAIRTGTPGVAVLAARADHNHPIRRQVAPAQPTITIGGTGFVLVNTSLNATVTDEESVTFFMTLQVTQTAVNSWNFFTVPNIAGFQRPEVVPTGSYRYTGNPTNDTTAPIDQTMVNAPSMNMEWSYYFNGTGYLNVPNRTQATGYYISFKVKYTRV